MDNTAISVHEDCQSTPPPPSYCPEKEKRGGNEGGKEEKEKEIRERQTSAHSNLGQ